MVYGLKLGLIFLKKNEFNRMKRDASSTFPRTNSEKTMQQKSPQ